jgi:uncharacterized protein YndB with AHSA1/START domain
MKMIIDIAEQIGAISRQVEQQQSEAGGIVTVTLERRYPAEVADVWPAITDPERLRRWFLPITGDLRPGGNFQLEGNAGGDILTCEAPRHLQVTFGSESSIVDVLLSGDRGETWLKLTHSVPLELAGSTAGALYVGPGWDGALLGMALYLNGAGQRRSRRCCQQSRGAGFQCQIDRGVGRRRRGLGDGRRGRDCGRAAGLVGTVRPRSRATRMSSCLPR